MRNGPREGKEGPSSRGANLNRRRNQCFGGVLLPWLGGVVSLLSFPPRQAGIVVVDPSTLFCVAHSQSPLAVTQACTDGGSERERGQSRERLAAAKGGRGRES